VVQNVILYCLIWVWSSVGGIQNLWVLETHFDIQRKMWWIIYQSQLGEWIPITIAPWIFLNCYLSAMWQRDISVPTNTIKYNRCISITTGVPVMNIWSRLCCMLSFMSSTTLTMQIISTYIPLLMNSESHVLPICYPCSIVRKPKYSTPYYNSYNFWAKLMTIASIEESNSPNPWSHWKISDYPTMNCYSIWHSRGLGRWS